MSHGTSLAGFPATIDVNQDIERIQMICKHQRLAYDNATGLKGKKLIDRLVVDDDLAFTGFDENARNGALAAAGSIVVLDCCHVIP